MYDASCFFFFSIFNSFYFIYFIYLFLLIVLFIFSIVDRPHQLVSCYYYRAKIKVFFFFFFLILTCPLIFLDIFPFHDYLKEFLKHVLLNSWPRHNKKGGRLIVTGILISPMDSFM